MRNHALATLIVRLMTAAILLALVMVLGTLAWAAREHDRRIAEHTRRAVEERLTAAFERMQSTAADYAARTDAAAGAPGGDAAGPRDKPAWGAGEDGAFDVIAVHRLEDGETTQWAAETGGLVRSGAIPRTVMDDMASRLRNDAAAGPDTVAAAHKLRDGQVYVLAASRIEPRDRRPAAAPAVIVIGRALDRDWVLDLGGTLPVQDLRLQGTAPARDPSLPVMGADGTPLAWLSWTAPRSGPGMINTAMIPLSLGLALYLALAVTATLLAWRGARQLAEVEALSARTSRTDPLTGLPNRLAFSETLGETLRGTQRPCALLQIDVNGFRRINDSVGHGGGDALIQLLGEELRRHLPDGAGLARLGGNEFAVIFRGEDAGDRARTYCAALSAALQRSFAIEGRSFTLSIAMGYAVAPPGRLSTGEFMRRADLAMSEAKTRRMSRPMQYDPSLEHDAPHQLKIEESLRFTMDRAGDLQVHYQPICDAVTGQMVMAEALLRWMSPELGRVSPMRFIPVAESSGLIVDLGYRLIDQVCRDLKAWPQLQVSINVSPAQLREACFIDKLTAIVERHGVAPGRIEIELTEGLLVENPDMAAFKLDNLREAGHRIALDDFGTGFSSIGYLRRMNFDKLKIDKSFVADIGVRPSAENLLQSMSLLARSLRLTTVAEGVESIDQAARLRAMGFDLLQGHLFGLAVSIDELKATFGSRVPQVRP